jgi:hypothetical protein
MKKTFFNLSYSIPQRKHQRGSRQTIKNLTKQDLSSWIAWLNTKQGATYSIK